MRHRVEVWDLPLRVFHWVLAATVTVAFATGFVGGNAMVWHGRAGTVLAALLAFRIVWGFLGSHHARFATFLPTPGKLRAYLGGTWKGEGHNPLGALSVFAMLGLLSAQLATGLAGNDDIAFQGSLYNLFTKADSDFATSLHRKMVWLLLTLIGLHLAAIAFYARFKKRNLVKPMILGWTESGEATDKKLTRPLSGLIALLLALSAATFVAWATQGTWIPRPNVVETSSPPPAW